MKKVFLICSLLSIFATLPLHSQQSQANVPTDLPDVSVIGNFIGIQSKSSKTFSIQEIELAFQHYLYPSIKTDIFLGLHKDEKGKTELDIEEAYLSFSNLIEILHPNTMSNFGVGAILGKKLINVGKYNPLHPEQVSFVGRPIAIQQFFGGEEGLAGEGASLSYLLPLPFFSQLEVGYWGVSMHQHDDHLNTVSSLQSALGAHNEDDHDIDDHDDDDHDDDTHTTAHSDHENMHGSTMEDAHSTGINYKNSITNARLWNSFELSDSQELELGINMVYGNIGSKNDLEKQEVAGFDLTYTKDFGLGKKLKLQTEFYTAKYGEEDHKRHNQSGGYASAFYSINSYYNTGIRYGFLSKHEDEDHRKTQLSLMLTRQLTETSKFRLQYNTGKEIEKAFIAQFIFGIGPHAHVLQ